ncbi:hypothetical protein [Frigoriflavimonas asaccharolytica]|uniref:Uncharacterized protein n=1 Tax=Frigoriflavimonas asaccharolytica TaxID=2735899 RepID=A0A8J8KAP0_9FLAO|nr:hypothetical protein [Frigoriflavimonas asaccharolytica]NRS91684.1 hypothetical protein [Frigoriflavimonas asaccharolytica]
MKNYVSILMLFCAPFLFAQNFNWDTALSQIYVPTSGFSPQKVLLDKAPMFADLYNFNYPEHNISNADHFQQSLSELYTASSNQYFANPTTLPKFEQVIGTATEIPIGILSTKTSYLNYDDENNNNGNLRLVNGVFSAINNINPKFIEKDLLVVSTLFPAFTSGTNNFTFKIDTNQFYQYGNTIQKLEANFGDGVWHLLVNNYVVQPAVSVNLNITSVEKKTINYRAVLQNGSTINTPLPFCFPRKL